MAITAEIQRNIQEKQHCKAKEKYTLLLVPITMEISSKINFIRVEYSSIQVKTTIMERGNTTRPQDSANSTIIKA